MLNSFDTQIQTEETIPCCPYCDKSLDTDGPVHDGMHAECNYQFGLDLKEAFPDPIDILICPSDKFLPIAEYDWLEDIDAFINLCWPGENDGDYDHALQVYSDMGESSDYRS